MHKREKLAINNFYITSWLTLCFITFLCYTPFIFSFTWGNHDWEWIKEYTPITSGFFEGRFSQFILQTILFEGNILPIVTLLIALSFLSATAIILSKLYNIPQKKHLYILLSISLTTAPYTISWLYFSFITLSCLAWTFFIVLSFYVLNKTKKILSPQSLIATILLTLSLGGYAPTINLIGVIFFSLIIFDINSKKTTIHNLIQKYLPHIITILSSITLFLFILHILKKYNLMQTTYNTAQININDILPKTIICIKTAITQFFNITTFISNKYKYCNLLLVLLSIYTIIKKIYKKPSMLFIFILTFIGLLLSTTLTIFVAQNTHYVLNEPRIDFYGILFIYLFSASILLKNNSQLIKNITYILLSIIIFYNITTLAYANKIWSLGFQAENKLSERIIARIENTPKFNPHNKHTFIQGGNIDFRSKYHIKSEKKPDSYTLTAPFIPWHLPSKAYKFYQPYDFFGEDFDTFWRFINPNIIYTNPNAIKYIEQNQSVWPKQDSLYIDNSIIILNLTPEGVNNSKRWLYEHL